MDMHRSFAPSRERFISSMKARMHTRMQPLIPPQSPDMQGMTDLHVHCSAGYMADLLATGQFAARSGMRGLLIKTYLQHKSPSPALDIGPVQAQLDAWCGAEGLTPTVLKAGYVFRYFPAEPDLRLLRQNLQDGVQGVWLPFSNALRTWMTISPTLDGEPLTRVEALAKGAITTIDDNGELKPDFKGAIELIAEFDRSLHFGHRFLDELYACVAYAKTCGVKRMVVDHPFSRFVDLTGAQMRRLAADGVKFNLTYNEISPVCGVDPQAMAEAIAAIGAEHFTLSSDVGEYHFPNSVEAVRLLHETLRCYGVSEGDIQRAGAVNGSFILGLSQ